MIYTYICCLPGVVTNIGHMVLSVLGKEQKTLAWVAVVSQTDISNDSKTPECEEKQCSWRPLV